MKLLKIFSAILLLSTSICAQQWVNFFANAKVTCQAIEGQYIWVGTENCLTKLNTQTGEVAGFYRDFGTGSNDISSIAIDQHGNKWIGTSGGGFAEFDGQKWTVYNISFGQGDYVSSMEIDLQGNIWLGTQDGIAKFNGQTSTVFNTSNSKIPHSHVTSIAIDEQGNKWIGTENGLSVFREEGVILADVKKDNTSIPESFSLSQNYPNPFNPSTTINYSIPDGRMVTLKAYDILGKEVTTILNEYQDAGSHSCQFNASSLPSGIYIYTIPAGEFMDSKKLVLLK